MDDENTHSFTPHDFIGTIRHDVAHEGHHRTIKDPTKASNDDENTHLGLRKSNIALSLKTVQNNPPVTTFATLRPRGIPRDVDSIPTKFEIERQQDLVCPRGEFDEYARLPPIQSLKTANDADTLHKMPKRTKKETERHLVITEKPTDKEKADNEEKIRIKMEHARRMRDLNLPPMMGNPDDARSRNKTNRPLQLQQPIKQTESDEDVNVDESKPKKVTDDKDKTTPVEREKKKKLFEDDIEGSGETAPDDMPPKKTKIRGEFPGRRTRPRNNSRTLTGLDALRTFDRYIRGLPASKSEPEFYRIGERRWWFPARTKGEEKSSTSTNSPSTSTESSTTTSSSTTTKYRTKYSGGGGGGGGGCGNCGGVQEQLLMLLAMAMMGGGTGCSYNGGYIDFPTPPEEKEEQKKCQNPKKCHGMSFDFMPHQDCKTEISLTVDPDDPDPLESAIDNGVMPIVCCYMPPCMAMDPNSKLWQGGLGLGSQTTTGYSSSYGSGSGSSSGSGYSSSKSTKKTPGTSDPARSNE